MAAASYERRVVLDLCASRQLFFPRVPTVGCSGVRRWAGRGYRSFVAAARCARGLPRPVLRFCRRRRSGSCVLIRRGRPIECATVESKSFSLLDSSAAYQWTTPAFARVYWNSTHEHRRRVYRPRNKLTCCRASWSGDKVAIRSQPSVNSQTSRGT